ncbi:nucleotidyltransferase domain-containing protein [Qipengyuania soli]|uniref:Nucleotidyltransferase family protein n=1 Tax=Qipengyuania soli TaxID=2782568 RepID=A0A7S8IVI0_9SPHN|nr:nucleotidyltransferase family protein [Qipengyuania soli]QPC98836.1 nucleotidyltransferase family protein [Qipengyuania soli]
MADAPLEYVLVELAGGKRPDAAFGEWDALDLRAAEHRVQPLLHRLHGQDEAIPVQVRDNWAQAYRASAVEALLQRRELLGIAGLFAQHDVPFLALKGSWLAWHAWPEPALRPLRDLDLFLPGTSALDAYALLLAEGWRHDADDGPGPLGAKGWLARFKALPPPTSPGGVVVDLHARLWDDDGRTPPQPADLFVHAACDPDHPALRYPGPVDQLMHLAVHAGFHRFDGGPLMLVDFAHLVSRHRFDWQTVWARAGTEGWLAHLALCLAGARRWAGIDAPWPDLPVEIPGDLVEHLPLLLAKPLEAREDDIASAKAARSSLTLGAKIRRALARRERHESLGDYLGWAGRQAAGVLRSTFGASDRMAAIAAIDDFLES